MNKKLLYTVIGILVIMIISNFILISMIIDYKNTIPERIESTVNKTVKELKIYDKIDSLIDLKVSSIKLVNGSDGKDGLSIKGETGDKGDSIKGENGLNAYELAVRNGFIGTEDEWQQSLKGNDGINPYFELQCNEIRNRWEAKFNPDDDWQTLNGKSVPCTIKE